MGLNRKQTPIDDLTQFKQAQKDGWRHFAPMEALTTPCAARLVKFGGVAKGMRVLDVGCGTGVVAVTATRLGARVKAADLTPQLLQRARENSRLAEVGEKTLTDGTDIPHYCHPDQRHRSAKPIDVRVEGP